MPNEEIIDADVVIVGGGLAGLTAAVGLGAQGLSCVVVERESILGGRARSWTDAETGDPVHIGPHIFLSEYPNMLKLLDVVGGRERIIWQDEQSILLVEGREEIEMRMAKLPAPLHFVPSLIADSHVSGKDLLSNLPVSLFAMQLTEADILRLDDVNAVALLRSMRVTDYFIQRFWGFASMSIMNVPVELCSAGALLRFYRRLIGHSAYSIGFPDGGLGDVFAPQAKARIEGFGGQVLLDTEVRRFCGSDERVTGVELADGRQIKAKACIAALPPQALRRLARPAWVTRHAAFRDLVHFVPSPYVSTYLWFDRKLTDRQFWARVYDPNDFSCDFYDLSNINRGWAHRPSVITTNCIWSTRAEGLSDAEIVAETVRELAEYLPEAAAAKVEHSVVNRIPMAIHCPYPGTEQRRPGVTTPVDGLFLAGDWIRSGLPASMESACQAGWQAAEAVLRREGRPATLVQAHKEVEGLASVVRWSSKLLPFRPARLYTAPLA